MKRGLASAQFGHGTLDRGQAAVRGGGGCARARRSLPGEGAGLVFRRVARGGDGFTDEQAHHVGVDGVVLGLVDEARGRLGGAGFFDGGQRGAGLVELGLKFGQRGGGRGVAGGRGGRSGGFGRGGQACSFRTRKVVMRERGEREWGVGGG